MLISIGNQRIFYFSGFRCIFYEKQRCSNLTLFVTKISSKKAYSLRSFTETIIRSLHGIKSTNFYIKIQRNIHYFYMVITFIAFVLVWN